MIGGGDIWRQRLWVWVPALVFFAANAVAWGVYRFGYADRNLSLAEDLGRQKQEAKQQTAEAARLKNLWDLAQSNQDQVKQLYQEHFSTRRRRLTEVTAEVKSLAEKAGMRPKALSYPEQEIQAYGLVKRSFVFSVEGTYLDLRKFINLLELSDSFLTLESMALAGGGGKGQELRIDLTLSTLFAKEGAAPAGAGAHARGAAVEAQP
jgi:type IV pilus assembly protein PilO